ncbi:cytochrome c [Gammaproteobacteria bacterium]|nr:cytochrome c [Gammaproteobacteria bacterium]
MLPFLLSVNKLKAIAVDDLQMKALIILFFTFASTILLAEAEKPEDLYGLHCGACHDKKGEGTIMLERRLGEEKAILADRKNLSDSYIRAVVRKGIGTMQSIGNEELSDEQLALISAYLIAKKYSN